MTTTTKPAAPFTPTTVPLPNDRHYPGTCYCCGRHARGVGIGRPPADPRYLCEACSLLMQQIREIRNLSVYEHAAVTRAVDAVGGFIEKHGSDLAEWESDTAEEFIRAIWIACGDALRDVIREGEVPW